MSTTPLGALVASLGLFCLTPQSGPATEPGPATSYVVQCEVWNALDPALVQAIEAMEPTAAEAALESLRGADQGVQRMARVLSPIDVGSQARFASEHEFALVNVVQGGGGVQTSFGGYTSTGTEVALSCQPSRSAEQVTTAFSLEFTGILGDEQEQERAPGIPPNRRSVQVHSQATAASGELRMVQFQTGEPGTLLIFLRATAL